MPAVILKLLSLAAVVTVLSNPAVAQIKPPPSAKALSELPWLEKAPEPVKRPSKDITPPTPSAKGLPAKAEPDIALPVQRPAEKPKPKKAYVPAKKLFGAKRKAAELKPRAIGFYSEGCLAGAARLPDNGKAWQAMRLSRNRHWGHPKLVALLQRLATDVQEKDGWPGLLMGDISQPRGGPMLTGHASHQVGLDADIWMTPMPDRRLTNKERENISATSMLAPGLVTVNKHWKPGHVKVLKRAASYPSIERILVHPAIKGELCRVAGEDRGWLSKVRPYWGHHYHFHIRMKCPADSPNCRPQKPPLNDDGCGKELKWWLNVVKPKPPPKVKPKPKPKPKKPVVKRREKTLDDLPMECRSVLAARPSTVEAALKRGER